MSLVQAIVTEDFALVCGDTRSVNLDGSSRKDTYNKVIRLNKNIIFGVTGDVKDNFKLFDGFCYLHSIYGFVNSEQNFEDLSYNEFINVISNRFTLMSDEHNSNENNVRYNIKSMIAGYNGKCFEVTCFLLVNDNTVSPCVRKLRKKSQNPCDIATLGYTIHDDNLKDFIIEENPKTIRQYKNVLQSTFDIGMKNDKSINNICHFETIRKCDILNGRMDNNKSL